MLIVPTYNGRDSVAPPVCRIRLVAADEGVFFVDDNSPDGIAAEIRRRDATSGFVGYRATMLRLLDLDAIRSDGFAFLMEVKFEFRRLGEFPIVFGAVGEIS
jgi:hypothetical protein